MGATDGTALGRDGGRGGRGPAPHRPARGRRRSRLHTDRRPGALSTGPLISTRLTRAAPGALHGHDHHRQSASTRSTGGSCARSSTPSGTPSPRRCSTTRSAPSSTTCSTAAASARPSTWRAIASATAATATSTTRSPTPSAQLREGFYGHLAPIANDWAGLLRGDEPTFPATHAELLERCAAAGQTRPTPLILRYGEGDWNALHQDLYGDVYFPFQVLTVLSEPGRLRGRRVRADGAAPARAEPRARRAAAARARS